MLDDEKKAGLEFPIKVARAANGGFIVHSQYGDKNLAAFSGLADFVEWLAAETGDDPFGERVENRPAPDAAAENHGTAHFDARLRDIANAVGADATRQGVFAKARLAECEGPMVSRALADLPNPPAPWPPRPVRGVSEPVAIEDCADPVEDAPAPASRTKELVTGRYSDEEEDRLRQMLAQGIGPSEIAAALNRDPKSVQMKCYHLRKLTEAVKDGGVAVQQAEPEPEPPAEDAPAKPKGLPMIRKASKSGYPAASQAIFDDIYILEQAAQGSDWFVVADQLGMSAGLVQARFRQLIPEPTIDAIPKALKELRARLEQLKEDAA